MTKDTEPLQEAIRAMPFDVNDDYDEVRRDERERIMARLQEKDAAQWFTTPNWTDLAAMKRAEQAIGAAISNGSMQSVERAYNTMRDLIDRALATPASDVAPVGDEWDGPLTTGEQARIDAAWEKHKAAGEGQ